MRADESRGACVGVGWGRGSYEGIRGAGGRLGTVMGVGLVGTGLGKRWDGWMSSIIMSLSTGRQFENLGNWKARKIEVTSSSVTTLMRFLRIMVEQNTSESERASDWVCVRSGKTP